MKMLSKEEMENMDLRYYNTEIHKASFILPEFARKVKHFRPVKRLLFLFCFTLNEFYFFFSSC